MHSRQLQWLLVLLGFFFFFFCLLSVYNQRVYIMHKSSKCVCYYYIFQCLTVITMATGEEKKKEVWYWPDLWMKSWSACKLTQLPLVLLCLKCFLLFIFIYSSKNLPCLLQQPQLVVRKILLFVYFSCFFFISTFM